jgi:uracil-DNA glycosylase
MAPTRQVDPQLLAAAAERLHEELLELGVDLLPPAAVPQVEPMARRAPAAAVTSQPADPLAALAQEIATCTACGLCEDRQNTVPGEGHPQARIVFVGEAPGTEEDATGRPFVGEAGQLLDKIIRAGMGLGREQVFLCNLLKCRPAQNREPSSSEKASCAPFLVKQLQAIRPELVVALGRDAANHLLGVDQTLASLRGKLHQTALGFPILVTYHPADLLLAPAAKADCWQDIQLGMRHLGMPVPPRNS